MLTGHEIRRKFLEFYAARGHQIIPSAPLVPQNDPTTLFTGSGMQPMLPYLLGEPHPLGNRLADSQKCFRAQDIEEVGDNRHDTFFEMLGNWSLGDYFKEAQLAWLWEFLTRELNLPPEKLYVSVFAGLDAIPKDEETAAIWLKLGVPQERIFYYGVEKNWWSRSGPPLHMPPGEPGGPDSEVFFEFEEVEHDLKYGNLCHPNCDCGRFLEIGNSVFMQYQKQADGSLKELSQKNVDFGGGLERLSMAANDLPDMFKTDLFLPLIKKIETLTGQSYETNAPAMRIIADHLKASVFLVKDGVLPANKLQGYILRRLIRRAALKAQRLKAGLSGASLSELIRPVFDIYQDVYFHDNEDYQVIESVIGQEIDRFQRTLAKGLKILERQPVIDGKVAFDLLQTYGFPWELTLEIAAEKGQSLNRQEFEAEFAKHQALSRSTSAGLFKGGLADQSETVTRYHTATHLLHQALRDVLGDHVHQAGSNITPERLRFDFTHPQALSETELTRVEAIVNQKITENLPVTSKIMPYEAALKEGALAFFKEKYPDRVTVYLIGDYSKELCGGPHVKASSEIGKIKVVKQDSPGSSLRRLYLKLDSQNAS